MLLTGEVRARPRRPVLNGTVLLLGAICLALAVTALAVGGPSRLEAGAREAFATFSTVGLQLALGFLMAGLVSVLIPQSTIAGLVGAESGVGGLAIATAAGAFTPGGPFLQFPLVASLLRGGAGEGAVAAYLTAWSLLGLQRVFVWELPVMGQTFTVVRWLSCLMLPMVVGLVVPVLLRVSRQP